MNTIVQVDALEGRYYVDAEGNLYRPVMGEFRPVTLRQRSKKQDARDYYLVQHDEQYYVFYKDELIEKQRATRARARPRAS